MTQELLGTGFAALPDVTQATIEGGGGGLVHDIACAVGAAVYYVDQAITFGTVIAAGTGYMF